MSCDWHKILTFSRALHQLHISASGFDWFTGLPASFVIGQSDYFGFDFTTLEVKPLQRFWTSTSFSTYLSALCTTDTGVSGGGGTDGGGAGEKFWNPRLTGSEDTCGMTRIFS